MSKKTPIKKSKRRLKRSVRKSLAAVLMITAIAVAAIPVPENYADSGDDSTGDVSAKGYQETVIASKPYEYESLVSGSQAVYSLDIYKEGLYWQYRIDSKARKVLEYNGSYPSTSLTLADTVPLNYYYVKSSEFDAYRNTGYTITVAEYCDSSTKDLAKIKNFFNTYFKNDSDYLAFQEYVKQYQNGTDIDVSAIANESITKYIYNLDDTSIRTYYCSQELKLDDHILMPITNQISSEDTEVIDQIDRVYNSDSSGNSIAGATLVYIPYFIGETKPTGFGAKHDEKGYYLSENNSDQLAATQKISSIGQYAFAGSGVLQTIDLPDWIDTISTGAFMNCDYLQSVNIPFVQTVSEGAFKNCTNLTTVNWWMTGDGGGKSTRLSTIGKEAFYGTNVRENESGTGVLRFPSGITEIADAAFYGCGTTNIEFETSTTTGLAIQQYAFYDNTSLTKVTFNDKRINSFGDYSFAVGVAKNSMTEFTFPNSPFTTGEGILANRSVLTKITVPENVSTLAGNILTGCTNLGVAEFLGVDTTYDKTLFNDVTNEEFYVTGYATMNKADKKDNVSNASNPRRSTWDAEKTAADQYIPYKYTLNGKDYYEICSGEGYLESIEIDKNGKGTLTSVDLKEGVVIKNGELVIPDKVGNIEVTKIASDCFKGKDKIAGSVRTLVVGNYITDIADSVFKSWSSLEKVEIGKSIQNIGKEAFANCENLTDVTFATPDSYETLKSIGADAFATNSGKLTIHGDLVDGYAPFEYAVDPNNYVNGKALASGNINKYRILYQSRWDSPSSKHMSVIYGEYDDGNGYVTLVDYPLYKDFYADDGTKNLSADLEEHNRDMEKQFYNAFGNYLYPTEEDAYLELKVRFAKAYSEKQDDAYEATDNDGRALYGPWINPSFCSNYEKWLDEKWLAKYELADASGNGVMDWLFTPMTVKAAGSPEPYFEKHPYNFLDNYQHYNGDRSQIQVEYIDGWTLDEEAMMKAFEEIVIPAGVDSIDIKSYYDAKDSGATNIASNSANYILYFGKSSDTNREGIFVYGVPDEDAGLFRGNIDDGYKDNDKQIDIGEHKKGNDRIKKVDMRQSGVKYIPDYAFDDCQILQEVSIPASCTATGKLPFRGCGEMITLTSDSEDVPAKNGILYQKKPDLSYELVECLLAKGVKGEGSTVTSANDDPYISQVSSIGESAFEDCAGITLVDLSGIDNGASSNKLKAIPDNCFKNCDNLQKVYLPLATNDIGQYAFAYIREDVYSREPLRDQPRLEITIRGTEFNVSETAFDPKTKDNKGTINMVTIWTYEDTAAERYVLEQQKLGYDIRLGNEGKDHDNHEYLSKTKRVNFWDYDGTALCSTIYLTNNEDRINEEDIPTEVIETVKAAGHRPGYVFKGWLSTDGKQLGKPIETEEITYIAQYESDGTLVNGKYEICFVDGITGESLYGPGATKVGTRWVYYIEPLPADSKETLNFDYLLKSSDGEIEAPTEKTHDGYEFLQWNANASAWTTKTEITSSMTIISLYKQITSGNNSGGNTSGNTTNTSNGTTNNNNSSKNSSNSSKNSSSTSSSNTSSSNNSSSTSGSGSQAGVYTVLVENGSGSGSYTAGSTVIIAANTPAEGMVFQKWTTESNGVTLASVSMPATTFIMPANNVTVTANYVAGTNNNTAAATSTNGTGNGGSTTGNNGNTRVDITKPGISNKDLATANVNGSTDNFIVKIAETDEATQAVAAALTNKYGSLDNILYYAMDITLWDSTGTYQLTGDQVAGLSVDITIPIPDALVAYGGNNMAGAVVNGDQLENLNENFTTINGVPCIRFTATHFSPYTIFVDTGNLTEGMLDVTPKTGDPIHPKWFLSIGLACLSIILFMKKDKAVKVK